MGKQSGNLGGLVNPHARRTVREGKGGGEDVGWSILDAI